MLAGIRTSDKLIEIREFVINRGEEHGKSKNQNSSHSPHSPRVGGMVHDLDLVLFCCFGHGDALFSLSDRLSTARWRKFAYRSCFVGRIITLPWRLDPFGFLESGRLRKRCDHFWHWSGVVYR